jgi:hypothetical protein
MTVNRRSVIKSAGAVGATLMAPGLPMWAHADEPPAQTAPLDYVGLSSALVNVDTDVLTLAQDGASLADVYYSICVAAAPSAIRSALTLYDFLIDQDQSPTYIANFFLRRDVEDPTAPGTTDSAAIARLTMAMWLFGTWYGGTEVARIEDSKQYIDSAYQNDFVVSSRAYKDGWIWRLAQAHPFGFSNFRFGSWQAAPPSLDSYLHPNG